MVCAVILLIKKKLPFKICRSDFRLNDQCGKFFTIGLPLALQECLTQLSFLALCAFVNRLGLEASSGYGGACKIVNFAMLIPSSLMQSMASFVSQNVGAGNQKRARQSMFTGIGVGLFFGCFVFALVLLKGDVLSGFFTAESSVIRNAYAYLKGFAPETLLTVVLFSMIGYFNGNDKTFWVMCQGLIQTLLIRLPISYYMSIQPNASLTRIGLAAPVSTAVGICLNIGFFLWLNRECAKKASQQLCLYWSGGSGFYISGRLCAVQNAPRMLRHCHNSRNMKSLHFSTIYNSLFIALYISSFNSSSLSYVSFIIAVIILYSNSLSILLAATFKLIFSIFIKKVFAIPKYPCNK